MNKVIKSGIVLITLLMSNVVWSETITDSSLNKLMAISGLNKQVVQIPGVLQAAILQARQQGGKMSDAMFSNLQKSAENSFQPSDILNIIAKEIKNNLSEVEAKKLFSWFESGLGRKITKAEENASTPAAYQQMMKEAQHLLSDKVRVKLSLELDDLLNGTDMTMEIQEHTGIAVYTAISKAMNPSQPVKLEPYKAQLSAQRQQMRAQIQQLVTVSFLYSYKNIKIENLNKYIKFLKSPASKQLNDSAIKGMVTAFNQSINKMANLLAVFYEKQVKK